jgi:hypothetical protein
MGRTTSLIAALLLTITASVGAIILAGQSVAAPAPPLPAGARAWEYKVFNEIQINGLGRQPAVQGGPIAERQPFAEGINNLGAEGWELVAIHGNVPPTYYFKRPK